MIINEIAVAIFNPSDFQDQRARKSQLYREMRKALQYMFLFHIFFRMNQETTVGRAG